MKKVHFYHFQKNKADTYHYLARLVEKAYLLNNTIFIFTDTTKEADFLDDWLWTFRDSSFLPHNLLHEGNFNNSPILISHKAPPASKEILINLSQTIPEFYVQFKRIIELISMENECQQVGKQKYQQYQKLGCQTHNFNIL